MESRNERKEPEYFRVLSETEEEVKKLLADHARAWDALTSRLLFDSSLTGEQVDQFLTGLLGQREV